jgi:DME family drug/metabolite transporter
LRPACSAATLLVLVARRFAPRAAACSARAVLAGAAAVAGYQLTFFAAVNETGVAVGTVVALRHLPASEVATLTLSEPLTAAALGAAVLGERPGVLALGGVALILAGLAALATPRRVRSRPAPVPS